MTLLLAMIAWAVALPAAAADIVGIVEGEAVLIRQTTRYRLVEGVVLRNEDIVETAQGAFVQIELGDGVLLGVGESTRLSLQPRLVVRGKAPLPRLYLLDGWLKLAQPAEQQAAFVLQSPNLDVSSQAATLVVNVGRGGGYAAFVESGTVRINERQGGRGALTLKTGDHAARAVGDTKPAAVTKVPPEFVAKVPRYFRDRLPARAALFADKKVTPRPLGEISYGDVAAWLGTEAPVRLPLSNLWRSRASDPEFRAAAKANLARHMEWEPYADPEGYARRKAEEAERQRAREAQEAERQRAREAQEAERQRAREAASASSSPVPGARTN